jgi:cathepsin F
MLKFACALLLATATDASFETWKKEHGKIYSGEEHKTRYATFQANKQRVASLNADEDDTAEYSIEGPFADLTQAEFAKQILMPKQPPADLAALADQVQLPEGAGNVTSCDWRTKGAVTAVKNQGTLGTCWAFSTIGNLEGQYFQKTSDLKDLSVEQLVECDASDDPKNGTADCGEFGGWPYMAFQYFMKAGGVRFDSEMPYCSGIEMGKPGTCEPCMAAGYSKKDCGSHDDDFAPLFCNKSTTKGQGPDGLCASKTGFASPVTNWKWVSFDEDDIAATLATVGPLSVALNAEVLQFYKKGVFDPKDFLCKKTSLDHGVLIVGFGTDDKKYWTVKNSWGPKWGEDGYFRIVRGEGKCGINTQVTTGVLG